MLFSSIGEEAADFEKGEAMGYFFTLDVTSFISVVFVHIVENITFKRLNLM